MNKKFITAGKPKIGGSIFVANEGTPLPTSALEELNAAFKDLGYASDSGVTNNNTPSSTTDTKAWGGTTVMSSTDEKTDEFGLTLLEVMNIDVLNFVFGEDNVEGTLEDEIHITINSNEPPSKSLVIDMLYGEDAIKRTVIPSAKISEIAEITYNDSDAVGYGLTLKALADSDGATHHEYIKKKA